jgi:hypothetical protein
MSSTSTNKQPLLIDRPLIEVEVLTTAAVGDRNQDTYKVQGGQGPILLVDMDRTLTDDDISGGVVDTIEIIRNESVPDADVIIAASGVATSVTYTTGTIVQAAENFFTPTTTLDQTTPATVDALVVAGVPASQLTLASGDLVHIPSGLPPASTITLLNAGNAINIGQYDYLYVSETGVVANPSTALPSGVGVYQYVNSLAISSPPSGLTYTVASGFQYLGTNPGSAFLSSGYYLYTGAGVTGYDAVLTYTTPSGFTRLGTAEVYYKYPVTFTQNDIIHVTTTDFLNSLGQLPNSTGAYQYTGENPLVARPDAVNFSAANGFTFLSPTLGSHPSGPGFYQYSNINSVVFFDRATLLTPDNGFIFIGSTLDETFDEIEICFYHVRQKVNPVANDGDYKFIGSVVLGPSDSRVDALAMLPHTTVPVPQVTGSLGADLPGRNRALFLQRGDAIYAGLYATAGTTVNYAPGVTIIAQGGYY